MIFGIACGPYIPAHILADAERRKPATPRPAALDEFTEPCTVYGCGADCKDIARCTALRAEVNTAASAWMAESESATIS